MTSGLLFRTAIKFLMQDRVRGVLLLNVGSGLISNRGLSEDAVCPNRQFGIPFYVFFSVCSMGEGCSFFNRSFVFAFCNRTKSLLPIALENFCVAAVQ